jgi:hypothetical protein
MKLLGWLCAGLLCLCLALLIRGEREVYEAVGERHRRAAGMQ